MSLVLRGTIPELLEIREIMHNIKKSGSICDLPTLPALVVELPLNLDALMLLQGKYMTG